jgi:superfamily II DNA or RNA helicase
MDGLRNGFAQGKRVQMLYSPTGSGKTEIAIALLEATKNKGNKGAMLLDRIILCDQTSQRLEKYAIPHGVLQAGHWRYRPYEHIQVCSAQTIEKRGSFPGLNLLIVDEAHQTRAATVEFIRNNPEVRVIGLSASPFTKGLGNIYENVVSTITTRELVDKKVLMPLKIFIAKEINMEGAKKLNTGEWNQQETEKRGMQITGDIVAEWIKMTHQVFGKPRKTIIFCSGVNHGADLSRKFAEQGYNFISISYQDDDEFKKEVVEDFAKPDTEIHGLIATDILTKGFDVPDVMIGVSARPFSKSLSSHVQQMGRVMRGCEGKEFALWLDHSGNYLRFQEEWEDVYNNGVLALDDGKEKSKPEKTEKEKEAAKCPKCGHLWAGGDTCVHCGYTREKRSMISEVEGEMEELKTSLSRDDKQAFYSMLKYKQRHDGWAESRVKANYKERFGVWPMGLSDAPVQPDVTFEKYLKYALIKYLKGKGKK